MEYDRTEKKADGLHERACVATMEQKSNILDFTVASLHIAARHDDILRTKDYGIAETEGRVKIRLLSYKVCLLRVASSVSLIHSP